MSHSIRPVSTADADAICRIYNHYVLNTAITFETEIVAAEDMAQRIDDVTANLPWLVAIDDGQLAGYAYASKWRPRAAYRHSVESTVYLSHNAAGRGLGTALYQALIAELAARPVHAVIGGIALPNEGSVALHEKLGFEKVAHFKHVGWKFDRWIDVGYWQRIL